MHSDETTQAKSRWVAKLNEKQKKIQVEANDGVTYVGQIEVTQGMNTQKLIEKIEKGQVQLISKTANKLVIAIAFLTITLLNAESIQIMKLQQKIKELEQKLDQAGKWEEEDLNSTESFNVNYEYRIKLNGSYICHCTHVEPTSLGYHYWGYYYYTESKCRKYSTTKVPVNSIAKRKIVI